MPTPALPADLQSRILDLLSAGRSERAVAAAVGVSKTAVHDVKVRHASPHGTPKVFADKRVGSFDWREACEAAKSMQRLKAKMSSSQDFAHVTLGDGTQPVILLGFGDQHIGSYGADYDALIALTDEIINTPNLYVALMGDYLEMAIKLRGVLEVTSQVLTPEMQEAFLESWLDAIQDKVAFATWDNHSILRQEGQAGTSNVKNILNRRFVYHNGIGHTDLLVGKQTYRCAASHKFNGGSMFNRMHAQGRYVRQMANDRELVLMGDIHQYGFSLTEDGGTERVYITGGTLHTNSGYAKRFFSLKTAKHYPCVVLHPDSHQMVPFKSVQQALRYIGQ